MRLTAAKLGLIIFASFFGFARTAGAEDVVIYTQFPSAYGSYGTVVSTGTTNLATRSGNVELATNNGRVAVGSAAPEGGSERALAVIGEVAGQHTATFRLNAGSTNGVYLGGYAAGGITAVAGSVQTIAGNLLLNSSGGNVGIGTTAPGAALHVNGKIGLMRGATTGEMKVDYDSTTGKFHATYAP